MAQDAVHAACVPCSGSNGTLVALHSTSRYPVTVTVHWHVDIHYVTYIVLQRKEAGKAGRTFDLEKALRTSSSQESFTKPSLGPETQTSPASAQLPYKYISSESSRPLRLRRRQHSPPAIRPSLSTRHSRPHPSIVILDRQEPPLFSERRRWLLLPLGSLSHVHLLHVRVPPGRGFMVSRQHGRRARCERGGVPDEVRLRLRRVDRRRCTLPRLLGSECG